MSDGDTWGQLKMCVPEWLLLENKKGKQHESADKQQEGTPSSPCLVVPLFPSSDAGYQHPLGIMMRMRFQVGLQDRYE